MNIPFGLLLKKLLSVLLQPPLMPLLLMLIGLVLQYWRPRAGRAIAWLGFATMLFLSTPATVNLLTRPLEDVPLLRHADLAHAQAIVILAGGQRTYMPEYGHPTPNRLTLERIRYGARLARESGLPVLVTGGGPTGPTAEGQLMADVLQEDFGIKVRWVERRSLDTHDNARFSAPLLRAAHIQRIVLVTHAAHMRRARAEFEAQGFEVFTAPTAFLSNSQFGEEFFAFLPNSTSAYAGWYAVHEWLGLAAQKMRMAFFKESPVSADESCDVPAAGAASAPAAKQAL